MTLLKYNDKAYHVFPDGRVSKKERGEVVFVPSDEAKAVVAEGESIPLFLGRYLVDRVNRAVVGPLCYLCEKGMREKFGKDAPRLTSKAVVEAEVARVTEQEEAGKAYQARREARVKERAEASEGAFEDLVKRTRKVYSPSGPGNSKATRNTRSWGK